MAFLSKITIAGVSAGIFFAFGGSAVEPQPKDARFIQEASQNSLFEIQAGELAELRSPVDQVKQYGQRMVSDYSDLQEQLKSLAVKDDFALPDTIGPKNQSTRDLLIDISGPVPLSQPAFDETYISEMIGAHETDLATFREESANGSNPDLRRWAAGAIPVLQEQLSVARNARDYLGSVSQVIKRSEGNGQW